MTVKHLIDPSYGSCVCSYMCKNQPCSHTNWNSFYFPILYLANYSILNKYACSLPPLANVYWSDLKGALCQQCKFTTDKMVPMEGSNLAVEIWHCCHCHCTYNVNLGIIVAHWPIVGTCGLITMQNSVISIVWLLLSWCWHHLHYSLPFPPVSYLHWSKIDAFLKNSPKSGIIWFVKLVV